MKDLFSRMNGLVYYRAGIGLCVAYLLFRMVFMNSLVNIAEQPDKGYHLAVADVYKKNPTVLFFWNSSKLNISCDDLSKYGSPVTTSPFLYHSIIGKIWSITGSLKLTSLIQSVFGLLTIFYIFKISTLLTKDKLVHVFTLVFITNLPMFTYIINFITYDNLINLAAAGSIYYLLKFNENKEVKKLFILLIFLLAGALTKISFGPLLVIVSTILIYLIIKDRKKIKDNFNIFIKDKKNWILVTIFFVFLFISGLFYGRNLVVYKSFNPSGDVVFERSCK